MKSAIAFTASQNSDNRLHMFRVIHFLENQCITIPPQRWKGHKIIWPMIIGMIIWPKKTYLLKFPYTPKSPNKTFKSQKILWSPHVSSPRHTARWPFGPVLSFSRFLSSDKSMCMHRSASSLGVQNEGCEFESFESLLHVVQIKHFHSLFIHLFTETNSTMEDFHYWTIEVLFKPYFESENIMKLKIKWKYQRMTTFFTKQHATKERIEKDWNDY